MKLTEAKLKQLIREAMEEEPLDEESKEYLLNLLRHEDREYQIQGVEVASTLLNQEDFQKAFRDQLNHVNGMELLSWLRQPSSRGPRIALDKYMTVPDGMSKEQRVFQLKFPNKAWREPISDEAQETWADRVQQTQSKLVSVAMSGNFEEWEQQWFAFKDFLKSFYEIHAPGFWGSLSDSQQMNTIYNRRNKPSLAKKSFDKAQEILDPTWRLAEPLARWLSRIKRDWSWSNGYSDKYDEDLDEPKQPDNPKYMEGWNAAIKEIDEESRGW